MNSDIHTKQCYWKPFQSKKTDTRHSEVIGKAAADDQRNNYNIKNLNANNTNDILNKLLCSVILLYLFLCH